MIQPNIQMLMHIFMQEQENMHSFKKIVQDIQADLQTQAVFMEILSQKRL